MIPTAIDPTNVTTALRPSPPVHLVSSGGFVYRRGFAEGLRPDPRITVTAWADEHRYLSRQASSEPGKYRTSRTPYVREILDALSPSDPCQDITVRKGTQLGLTEVGNTWIGYIIDLCPGPIIMGLPTVDLAKDHSKQKLDPMFEDCPRLRGKIKEPRSRDSGNTARSKEFPGGILFLIGANSPAGFRSKSIRFIFEDDVDGWPPEVGDEGDPASLIEKRADTFSSRKKIFRVSTPTVKNISRIDRAFEQSDQRFYHVACPYCLEKQPLEWGGKDTDYGIKFARDLAGNVLEAWYVCRSCHGEISEAHKTAMLENGEWVPTYPDRQKRGYHLSGLYSPLGWVSWRQVAQEFIEAKGSRERLKVWMNARLAVSFEERGDQPDWVPLKGRCEPYPFFMVPYGGELLTAGVDVQDDRLAVVVRAWGAEEESWLIAYTEIYGDTLQPHVWGQLNELLERPYAHADGRALHIHTMAIDSGHRTQQVYAWCRKRTQRVIAVKGASASGKAVLGRPSLQDVTGKGVNIKGGVMLWPVGTDTAKSTIYGRITQTGPGPGRYHWPIGLDDSYFIQLTAEKLVTTYGQNGFARQEWVKIAERNEALDIEVYAYAAAIRAGVFFKNLRPRGAAAETAEGGRTYAGRRVRSRGLDGA
jgi:phage terminase large subunit GpA-like protein